METTRIFRLSTLLMLGCMSCNYGFGQTVDVEEARSRAMDLLNQNRPKLANGRQRTNTDVETVKLSYTAQSEDSVFYYVFDYADGGFSIIGGDEVARTVLGYCPDGKFDQETMPDGLRFMLQCFESQIRAGMQAKNSIEEETNSARRASAREKSDITPLMKSSWGQGDPYDAKIPEYDERYGHFLVGCGATAAAQVMNYYKHPVKGLGFNKYQKTYDTDQGKKTLSFEADFGQTTYDWDNMPDDIIRHRSQTEPHYPIAEVEALSTLCYHVGVAMNMNYQKGGSASQNTSAIDALTKFFWYNKGARLEPRTSIVEDQWEQIIYDELAKGRPVLYYGDDRRYGGHAFVCDGYQAETNMFHMNWGWNGSSDGYYALTGDKALSPSIYNFEYAQSIVLDLYPAEETEWIPVEKIEIVDHIKLNGRLEAKVSPSNATLQDVYWSSTNPSVIDVDKNGNIKIYDSGIATITATACDGSGVTQSYCVVDDNVQVVGTPDVQSSIMPMGNFYKNSTVAMEFIRDEMFDMPVIINTISFNVATSSALEADIDIYMTDKFQSEDDLTEDDLVYRGHRTIGENAGWECIQLDRPYLYWGGDMLVIVTHRSQTYDGRLQYYCTKEDEDNKGYYMSYAKYRVSNTDSRYADATFSSEYTDSDLRPQVAFGYQSELEVQCGDAAQVEIDLFDVDKFCISGKGALWNDWQGKTHLYKQLTPYIRNMVIEPGITAIPSSAFEGVNGLEIVILADRYTSKRLSETDNLYVGVTYPGLEEIEDGAFAGMTDLYIVESGLIPPIIGPNTFNKETLKWTTLFVPEGSLEAYRNAPYWSDFENIQVLEGISKTYVGDMNKDKRLDVADLTSMVLQVKNETRTNQSNAYMDVNRDGWVNKDDVAALASILLRIRLK